MLNVVLLKGSQAEQSSLCNHLVWFDPPSLAEAHRVIESCLFWNIPTPHDKLVSKTTLSPILKLGGSKGRPPFALRSLLNKINMTHVKTNCPAALQRGKSSIGILPASCRYPTQTTF